jgi:hypothetical protein
LHFNASKTPSALNLGEEETTPTCYVSVGGGDRVDVPYQFDWVNFTNSIDNESFQVGAGLSVNNTNQLRR